jgi:hypothetical protein
MVTITRELQKIWWVESVLRGRYRDAYDSDEHSVSAFSGGPVGHGDFCSDEDIPALEICKLLKKHYGEGSVSQSQVYYWIRK